MWFAIAAITILVIGICIFIKIKKNKVINSKLTELAEKNNYKLTKCSSKEYNYILENDHNIIYLRTIIIPKNSSVTVNSKSTWCLRYGGGARVGRSYPNKEYLTELKPFLIKEYSSEKSIRKVVILYPTTEVLLKYVNESDIINLTQNDIVYGTQIIKFNDIDEFLIK